MNKLKYIFTEWVVPIAAALIIVLLVQRFIAFNIKVPTPSMYPTITPGDRIVVTRVYNADKLKRGDIIVFYSQELGERLVKRLIGLPKDTVEVRQDYSVYVNGKKISEPYVHNNGGKTGTFKVPEGEYFFLGDNRADSFDARMWVNPYISAKDIQGKAQLIFFPFNRMGKLK